MEGGGCREKFLPPLYKRLWNFATSGSKILALFARTTFKLKLSYFKALFSAVSMDIRLLLFIKELKRREKKKGSVCSMSSFQAVLLLLNQ